MSDGNVAVRIDGERAYVTLDRPDKHNGLTLEILRGLVDAANTVRRDRRVRAVILSGNGPSFSSGLDIARVMKRPAGIARAFTPRPWRGTNLVQESCWAWRRLPVPVIAAVHGRCYGGGLQLALAADFRISTPDCEWSVLEAKWGLIPDMSGSAALAQLVGIDHAKRLAMTAETFTGVRARELGLVTELADDPTVAAEDLAQRIAERSPDSVAGAKKLFDQTWNSSPRHAFSVERRIQLGLLLGRNTVIARKAAAAGGLPAFAPRKR
jgi:enoyl-CoA hydratase/carnithine racemase